MLKSLTGRDFLFQAINYVFNGSWFLVADTRFTVEDGRVVKKFLPSLQFHIVFWYEKGKCLHISEEKTREVNNF